MRQEGSTGELTPEGAILIVEDDAAQAQLIRLTLEDNGFRCEHVSTGKGALELVGSGRFPLMLVDYSLPDINGLDLVRTLAVDSAPVPPFIMITCTEDTRLAVSSMRVGARDFVLKDVDFLERLPAAVARVLKELETERRLREAESALRESEARLAKAQQIARMGSWEWDPPSGRLFCSAGMARLVGVPPRDLAEISATELLRRIHPADLDDVRDAFRESFRSGHLFNIDCRMLRDDGSEIAINVQGEVEQDEHGAPRMVSGTILDITERKRAENEIQQLAYYDSLTGLPNRTLLGDRLNQAIVQAHRDGRLVGVLFLDLDRFKAVNDTFGHLGGDRLLKSVAQRLVEVVRETDTVARIGGDEFVIVLTAITHEEDIGDIAAKILASLALPLHLDKREVVSTGSIGISIFPMDGEDVHMLLKNADLAMYNAKDLGKDTYRFFSREMNVKVIERHTLEAGMRRALERSEFSVHYQPQVDLVTGRLMGMEALIRWHHPEMGLVPNETFIPMAEESGLICSIGEWVLRSACARNRQWHDAGFGNLRVSVNLSSRQFRQKNLVALVRSVLEETRLDPQFLELELTESTIMANVDEAQRVLSQLKSMGVVISVDDFGTGYSSVHYLKRFALDRLKIDRSFLRGIPRSRDDASITEAIIAMGRSLGLKVMALGVEQPEQLQFLQARNCDEIQGFLVSRPQSAETITRLLFQSGTRGKGKRGHAEPSEWRHAESGGGKMFEWAFIT